LIAPINEVTMFREILNHSVWGNTVQSYLLALVVFILAVIAFRLVKYEVLKKLRNAVKKTRIEIDDLVIGVVDNVGWPFYVFFGMFLAVSFLQVPSIVNVFFSYAVPLVVVFLVVRSLHQFVDYGLRKVAKEKDFENESSLVNVIGRILKGGLWALAFIYALSLWGQDVTSIIASFGVIGIVLAFGLQRVLSDVFASFSIFFDKPFNAGDFIIVGDNMGVVKNVGIQSTRIQSLWGQEVVIPNQELTSTRINNYRKMKRRRVQFSFGVVYDTSAEQLEKVLDITKEIIEGIELVELDRVHFKDYGDFSLNFEVVYYVNISDYNTYMDIQQEINLKLKKQFEKEKIEFAYPTQTVIIDKQKQQE
jgi:small-conductance mechanosensitive channel